MNIINLFVIAIRALSRNRLRSFLTMLGIIIGVASVIAMISIGQGSKQSIRSQLSSMGSNMITVRPESNTTVGGGARLGSSDLQTLKVKDVENIKKYAHFISDISAGVSVSGQAINGNLNYPTTMQGVSPSYIKIREWKITNGIAFTETDVLNSSKVCLLGQTVIDNIFPQGGDPVGKIIRFNKIPFKVIGVLQKKGETSFGQDQDNIVMAPYTSVQKRIEGIRYVQSIYASAINEASSDTAVGEITKILRKDHSLKAGEDDDFSIHTQAELISTISSTSELLTVLLGAVAGISLLVGGIGIMNIMYVSVTERTKEIGLRMSIGAAGKDILLQFLVEAILISILGGLLGILTGIGTSKLVTIFLGWPTLISEGSVLLSFLVCAITGIFFGYYPALKASKLNPIDALHYE